MTPKRLPAQAITKAREQTKRIASKALKQARTIRASTRQARLKTVATVKVAQENAKVVTQQAVKLFRINLANTLTLLNGVFGFLSIIAAAREAFMLSAIFIIAGVLCDWLDGKAARAFSETSALGKELDSLSDLVTFGVAPAFLVAMIEPGLFSIAAGALFVLSAALRLGRFNVQQVEGVFYGVPTTVNGILLPLMIFLGAPYTWFPYYIAIFALLMNAPIKIKKVF